jgi:hypothetical protein
MEGAIEVRIEALARELTGFDPQAVSDACDEWCKANAFWPALAEFLPVVRDHQRIADAPRVTGRAASANPATDCVARLAYRGWPATRLAPLGYEAVEFILNNHAKGDDFVLNGLEMLAAGRIPKAQKREVPPPIGKPMAKAFELVRHPERFFQAVDLIGLYLKMVERAHGRDEAEFQAGQLAAEAKGQAAEALRPYTGAMA